MDIQLHNVDCIAWMATQPAASVDAIIADPPYKTTKLDFDQQVIDWGSWWEQAQRIIKPTGSIVLFAADLFTVDLINSNRDWYRYRMVWKKSRASSFLAANKRPLKQHEDVLVFGQNGDSSTFNPQKSPSGKPKKNIYNRGIDRAEHYGRHRSGAYIDDGTRYPSSVLEFDSVPTMLCLHPTQKPVDLVRWLIRTYTNKGERVVDTFFGSGTTAEACYLEDRAFDGCETDPLHFSNASRRIMALQAKPQLQLG